MEKGATTSSQYCFWDMDGVTGWMDVFGFKKIWHMHRMGNVVQQVEMEDQVGVGAFTTTG